MHYFPSGSRGKQARAALNALALISNVCAMMILERIRSSWNIFAGILLENLKNVEAMVIFFSLNDP